VGIVLFGIVKSTPAPDAGYRLLLDDLNRTKNDLDFAYANFQNVVEPDLIDAYIYEVNAMQLKYKFLLRRLINADGACRLPQLRCGGSYQTIP